MLKWNTFRKGEEPVAGEWYWICYKSIDSTGQNAISHGAAIFQDDDEWTVSGPVREDVDTEDVLGWCPLPMPDCDLDDVENCDDPAPNRYYWLLFNSVEEHDEWEDEDYDEDEDEEGDDSTDFLEMGLYTYNPEDYLWDSNLDVSGDETVLDEDVVRRVELTIMESKK